MPFSRTSAAAAGGTAQLRGREKSPKIARLAHYNFAPCGVGGRWRARGGHASQRGAVCVRVRAAISVLTLGAAPGEFPQLWVGVQGQGLRGLWGWGCRYHGKTRNQGRGNKCYKSTMGGQKSTMTEATMTEIPRVVFLPAGQMRVMLTRMS